MKRRFIYGVLTSCLVLLSLTACSSSNAENSQTQATASSAAKTEKNETSYPLEIKITDSEGKEHQQTFEKAPEKVVTNNLSSIEILLELGLKDKIVGTTQPDNKVTGKFADDVKDIPVIGDKMTVSKEKVAEYAPDIVVGRAMPFTDDSMGSVNTLNDLGIQTYIQTASNMTDNPPLTTVIDDVRTLGKIFNVNDRAEKYAQELEERYQAVQEQVKANKGDEKLTLLPMVAFDAEKSSFSVFNISGGLQSDLLKQLNVSPALEGSTSDPTLETIISSDPDIILYVTADRNAELDKTAVKNIKSEELLKDVSAIKENRIYTTTYDDFMDYGPRIFDTLEMLGNKLYTE